MHKVPSKLQGAVQDTIVLCPYCGTERGEVNEGCCGEVHCERHHMFSYLCGCVEFLNPLTGKTYQEPCEETRVRLN